MTKLSVAQMRHKIPVSDSTTRWRQKREDLHIQNHDRNNSHNINITIQDDDSVVHRGDYRLLPDQSGCSIALLSAGQYTVFAAVDETNHATADVHVSDSHTQTIYIKITADSVKIRQGLPQ